MVKMANRAFDPKVFLAVVGVGKTISKYRKGEIVFGHDGMRDYSSGEIHNGKNAP